MRERSGARFRARLLAAGHGVPGAGLVGSEPFIKTTPTIDDGSQPGVGRSQRPSSLRVDAAVFSLVGPLRRARLAWHASRNPVRRRLNASGGAPGLFDRG